jgi:hypothetical protein
MFEDGTEYYSEQTYHKPLISHFMFIGPDKRFVYTGYGNFHANTGANSVVINVTGDRRITFDDGQLIVLENCDVSLMLIIGIL